MVRSHPWISKEVPVRGFIFDVDTAVCERRWPTPGRPPDASHTEYRASPPCLIALWIPSGLARYLVGKTLVHDLATGRLIGPLFCRASHAATATDLRAAAGSGNRRRHPAPPWRPSGARRWTERRGYHALPSMHLDRPTLSFELLAVPDGVVKENVVFTHMHSDRGQTGKIAVKRGRQRIVRVPTCQIEPRHGGKLRRCRERVGVRTGHHALAGHRQVGPSRYHRRRPWEWDRSRCAPWRPPTKEGSGRDRRRRSCPQALCL